MKDGPFGDLHPTSQPEPPDGNIDSGQSGTFVCSFSAKFDELKNVVLELQWALECELVKASCGKFSPRDESELASVATQRKIASSEFTGDLASCLKTLCESQRRIEDKLKTMPFCPSSRTAKSTEQFQRHQNGDSTLLSGRPSFKKDPRIEMPKIPQTLMQLDCNGPAERVSPAGEETHSKRGQSSPRQAVRLSHQEDLLRISESCLEEVAEEAVPLDCVVRDKDKKTKTFKGQWSVDDDRKRSRKIRGNFSETMMETLQHRRRLFWTEFVNNEWFEIISGVLICGNAWFLGYETQIVAQSPGVDAVPDFELVHFLFSGYFLLELGLRIWTQGVRFWTGKDYRWNLVDFALCGISVIDVLVATIGMRQGLSVRALRSVRLVRLVRTIRIMRTLKSVREFQKMVYALLSSLRTLLCSMVILSFVMYIFAIIFTQGVAENRLYGSGEPIDNLETFYGKLDDSFLSLFMCSSNGISWWRAHEPLELLHPMYGYLFLVFIFTVLFGVLNVVTSVFVESAVMSAQHYKDLIIEEKQHERAIAFSHMKQVFMQIDEDNSGEITADEMEEFLQEPGLKKYVEALGISAEDTRMLFQLLDRDGSDRIDVKEFCEGCNRLRGDAKSFDVHAMIYTNRLFLNRWSDFTGYVAERFDMILPLINVSDCGAESDPGQLSGLSEQSG